MEWNYPLTPRDLRYLADRVEEIMDHIGRVSDLPYDDWRWGLSVKVWTPDSSVDTPAGVVAPHPDGWIGFYPTPIPGGEI